MNKSTAKKIDTFADCWLNKRVSTLVIVRKSYFVQKVQLRYLLVSLFYFALTILCSATTANAQDPAFSQFYSAPMHLNPGMAGMTYGPRGNLLYRNQWPAIEDGFVTYHGSFDMHVDKLGGGVGMSIYHDRISNILNTTSFKAAYAYQVKLSRKFGMKFGVEVGFVHRSLDWTALTFNDQIDPVFGFVDINGIPNPTTEAQPADLSYIYPDFGAGFVAFSRRVYGGFSIRHITRPKDNFVDPDSRLPILFNLHGGYEIDLAPNKRNKNLSLTPNIMLANQSNSFQVNLGTIFAFSMDNGGMHLGVAYRHALNNADAVIVLAGVKLGYVRVGYSYDITVSEFALDAGGAHEVSLSFTIFGDDNSLNSKRGKQTIECPGVLNF